jgi:hypothetical protein
MNTKTTRTKTGTVPKRRTVCLSLWVKPGVKRAISQRAASNGLSISTTGGALLERALQTETDLEYGALLEPVIERAISRHMRAYSARIALLQVRIAFSAEQTRSMLSEVLRRQPGVTEEVREQILDWSANLAKNKITAKTPQLQKIIDEVKQWFTEELDGEER